MQPLEVVRLVVFAVFVASAAAALGSWAVTTRRLGPFGRTAQLIRRLTDPLLTPVERMLLVRGKNPQHAPWWLIGISVLGGIIVIAASEWIATTWGRAGLAIDAGPRGIIRLTVYYAGQLILIALIARVIGSWVGIGRFNKWMRPAYLLTDWIVNPLRRIVPNFGAFDVTPIIAWFLLQIALGLILRSI
jgi:YggT family protein